MLDLPHSIIAVLAPFAPLFSRPTYWKLLTLFPGHLLSRGPRSISNALRHTGLKDEKHYSKFYDVFRRASWSPFKASKILLSLIERAWLGGDTIRIVVDTTLQRRRGPRIYGLGIHRDAVRSTKNRKAFSAGHNWLVACVLIRFPGTSVVWSLPFISILLKPKTPIKSSKNRKDLTERRRHKKVTRYTEQLVYVLRRWLGPKRKIILLGDSAFCCRTICRACQRCKVDLIARFRLDASLFAPPPPPTGHRGRRRIVGNRLPNLSDILHANDTHWVTYEVNWYGQKSHEVDLASGTALWYHNSTGKPVPIRWVLSRDHDNPDEVIAILCTNQNYTAKEIIESFVQRWSIETTFQEVRKHLGFEGIHTWADKGIERVAPSIMASYSIVCLIAAKALSQSSEKITPASTSWYEKELITFSDVYIYVKLLIVNDNIFPHPYEKSTLRKKVLWRVLYWALAA